MSATTNDNPLLTLDSAQLTPIVRKAVGHQSVELIDWQTQLVHGGATKNASVYEISGHAHAHGRSLPWSVMLKVWHWREGADDPTQRNYWKREALAYQSGLLDKLPSVLRAPRCFAVNELPGTASYLWLDKVADEDAARWEIPDFARVALHLGVFNGTYVVVRPLPTYPWLSRNWLRSWVNFCAAAIKELPQTLSHPLVRQHYPTQLADGLLRLWAEREHFLTALDHLPQTFCHRDAFPRNLFSRRDPTTPDHTVAIDWATAGIGALGEDLAALVGGSLVFFELDPSAAGEVDQQVSARYLEGVREAGWQGDASILRFGYTATLALRYGLGGILDLGIAADESAHAWAEQVLGHSITELVERTAVIGSFFLERANEARRLLPSL